MNAQTRSHFWLRLYESWQADTRERLSFRTQQDREHVLALIRNPLHQLHESPHLLIGDTSVVLPHAALSFLASIMVDYNISTEKVTPTSLGDF